MVKAQKPEVLRLEARLESIENIVKFSSQFAEIYFKDIDSQITRDATKIRDRIWELFKYVKTGKD
eukprot:16382301-Heterocapsa_arctica.AAC.1